MNPIEDKVRRRLAPFVAEGKIGAPQFSSLSGPAAALTVNVRLKSARSRGADVEAALHQALRDIGPEAQLVINPA
ncbi:MAG: hypothetical protein KGM42_17565 [Hyphomicrobiales bacterium]|nr:hypothetical protein [Hyphomicrobiales bacterium]